MSLNKHSRQQQAESYSTVLQQDTLQHTCETAPGRKAIDAPLTPDAMTVFCCPSTPEGNPAGSSALQDTMHTLTLHMLRIDLRTGNESVFTPLTFSWFCCCRWPRRSVSLRCCCLTLGRLVRQVGNICKLIFQEVQMRRVENIMFPAFYSLCDSWTFGHQSIGLRNTYMCPGVSVRACRSTATSLAPSHRSFKKTSNALPATSKSLRSMVSHT